MPRVRAKKALGQHFLRSSEVAASIVDALPGPANVLEVGPGMGVLSGRLLARQDLDTRLVEIDPESCLFLREHLTLAEGQLIEGDFLTLPLGGLWPGRHFSVIGNFPYNISSQIMFRVLEARDRVDAVVGMFQKEVAERLCASPGGRARGIQSVLLEAYFDRELLFEVPPALFDPPPKVTSAVVRLTRRRDGDPNCDYRELLKLVKGAFNQRRKTLRNSLRAAGYDTAALEETGLLARRPEELTVQQFAWLLERLG